MTQHPVFAVEAKARVADVVRTIEAGTSAEIVVALRVRSGHYRHTDMLVGSAVGFCSLLVFLFHPAPFAIEPFPLIFALAFVLGAAFSAHFEPLRRLLTSRTLLDENVRLAARAAFVDLGIGRTRGRSGILVYVSVFERRVELVHDIGIDEAALGDDYAAAKRALATVLTTSLDVAALEAALAALAPPLARVFPRSADDVNELDDEARS